MVISIDNGMGSLGEDALDGVIMKPCIAKFAPMVPSSELALSSASSREISANGWTHKIISLNVAFVCFIVAALLQEICPIKEETSAQFCSLH
jgi:hypothetical protein